MSANNSEFTQPNNLYLNENLTRCGIVDDMGSRNDNSEIMVATISVAGQSTLAAEIRPIQRRRRKVINSVFTLLNFRDLFAMSRQFIAIKDCSFMMNSGKFK
jgi:hypothetical protein